MRKLAIVLYPDVLMLDVAGLLDVFTVANRYLPKDKMYKVYTVAADKEPFYASNGVRMAADFSVDDASECFDLILIPGGPGADSRTHPALVSWIKSKLTAKYRCASVCGGVFILAATGLLERRRVATHRNDVDKFRQRFPKVIIERNKTVVRDGNILSCSGTTAGIELALSIVAEDHGKPLAIDIAKVGLAVTQYKGQQIQFEPISAEASDSQTPISKVQSYIIENISEPHKIEALADIANMSVRHFTRQFKSETGFSAIEYVQQCRFDRARQLLESTQLPLKTVAFHCGLSGANQLRNLFIKYFARCPSAYRDQSEEL